MLCKEVSQPMHLLQHGSSGRAGIALIAPKYLSGSWFPTSSKKGGFLACPSVVPPLCIMSVEKLSGHVLYVGPVIAIKGDRCTD